MSANAEEIQHIQSYLLPPKSGLFNAHFRVVGRKKWDQTIEEMDRDLGPFPHTHTRKCAPDRRNQ